jgi:hypothetical protein
MVPLPLPAVGTLLGVAPLRNVKLTRDGILFVGGLAGIAHETLVWDGTERPILTGVFVAMCGLPAFLIQDRAKANQAPPSAPVQSPPEPATPPQEASP